MTIGTELPDNGALGPQASFEFTAEIDPGEALVIDLEGFEGPLDLLLALARTQKLDLGGLSMLALAEQYLAFIEEARTLRLEVAADYLVMAAWLAFLKSRLLLPKDEISLEELTGEELAARLAFRLKRLAAMREAATRLVSRDRLGQDVFARGSPEGVRTLSESHYTANVYDFLKAYVDQRKRTSPARLTVKVREVWSIKDARARLERLLGVGNEWSALDTFLIHYMVTPELARTALASSFGATLELAREGQLDVRQAEAFAPVYVRRRPVIASGDA